MRPSSDVLLLRYLERHAEPEARAVFGSSALQGREERWGAVLVVPVAGEDIDFLEGYRVALSVSAAKGERPKLRNLVVVVLNAHAGTEAELVAANRRLRAAFERQFTKWQPLCAEPAIHLLQGDDFEVLLIERWLEPFLLPERAAVGGARKLGNDVALALMLRGLVESPWLYQTDADARLPDDAFRRERLLPACWQEPRAEREGVRLFAFRHVAESRAASAAVLCATLQYEVLLRYHVAGLTWAGSPYAFHALGSIIVVHARSYAQVRGFPKRAAGEDFYLLQKVNKLAPVIQMGGAPVRLEARVSSRAPFGTGPAVHALLTAPGLRLESPVSYGLLKHWLRRVHAYAAERSESALSWDAPWQATADDEPFAAHLLEHAKSTLLALGARERLLALLSEAAGGADLLGRAHTWFDALKAQRFLHALRGPLPMLPATLALQRAAFIPWHEFDASAWSSPTTSALDDVERCAAFCECLARLEVAPDPLAVSDET